MQLRLLLSQNYLARAEARVLQHGCCLQTGQSQVSDLSVLRPYFRCKLIRLESRDETDLHLDRPPLLT